MTFRFSKLAWRALRPYFSVAPAKPSRAPCVKNCMPTDTHCAPSVRMVPISATRSIKHIVIVLTTLNRTITQMMMARKAKPRCQQLLADAARNRIDLRCDRREAGRKRGSMRRWQAAKSSSAV